MGKHTKWKKPPNLYLEILKWVDAKQIFFFRWKSKLWVENSSVVKIYIIRPKPGPVAKNATPNPRPLDYQTSALPLSYRSRCRQLGREFSILGLIMYIFTTLEFSTHNFDFHLLTTSVNAKCFFFMWPNWFLLFLPCVGKEKVLCNIQSLASFDLVCREVHVSLPFMIICRNEE